MSPTTWMASRSLWIWLAFVLALALGCGKKEDPGPPCTKVADHVTEVVGKAYPGHADMMSAGARKNWVSSCESRKLTGKQRRCMMEAQTPDALASCIREKADEKKPEGPSGVVPVTGTPPVAPAPAATPPAAPAPGMTPPAASAPATAPSTAPAPGMTPPAASAPAAPPPAAPPPAAPAPR